MDIDDVGNLPGKWGKNGHRCSVFSGKQEPNMASPKKKPLLIEPYLILPLLFRVCMFVDSI